MLSSITEAIKNLENEPDFNDFYQDYIRSTQDSIIANEIAVNEYKMLHVGSFNPLLSQLNDLTEELKLL